MYTHAASITTDNSNDLPTPAKAIYVGGAGDLTVTTGSGEDVVFKAVPVGTVLPVKIKRVKATGTTATLLLALW